MFENAEAMLAQDELESPDLDMPLEEEQGHSKLKKQTQKVKNKTDSETYIADDKLSPQNARGQVDRIKKAVLNLDTFPQSHQERNEGRYAGKGYRQLLIDNYVVIFRIDELHKTVYVVTIQYQGRNL